MAERRNSSDHNEEGPSIRYLQCPASFQIQHLKRFLATKYDIDYTDHRIRLDIMYEDEILADDFTLMDVAYCYQWQRVSTAFNRAKTISNGLEVGRETWG